MPCTAGQSIPDCKLSVFCDGTNARTWHTCPLMHVPSATSCNVACCSAIGARESCQRIVSENRVKEFSCHQCQRKYVQCVLNPVPVVPATHTHARAHTPNARTHTHAHTHLVTPRSQKSVPRRRSIWCSRKLRTSWSSSILLRNVCTHTIIARCRWFPRMGARRRRALAQPRRTS